jgi:cell division protein ZipA
MDFLGPRDILVLLTILALAAVLLDAARRIKRNRYEKLQMSSRQLKKTSTDPEGYEDDDFDQSQFPSGGSRIIGSREVDEPVTAKTAHSQYTPGNNFGFSKPEQQGFDLDHSIFTTKDDAILDLETRSSARDVSDDNVQKSEDVLVIHLVTSKGDSIEGEQLLSAALEAGLRYGEMKIFHRHLHEDGSGPILFSMANLVNPGTFDLNTINTINIPGVTLFMALEDVVDTVSGFDIMLEAIDTIVAALPLNVMDESRSSMTRQTIDHYKQRAKKASLKNPVLN